MRVPVCSLASFKNPFLQTIVAEQKEARSDALMVSETFHRSPLLVFSPPFQSLPLSEPAPRCITDDREWREAVIEYWT
jgi:hypothetical protein